MLFDQNGDSMASYVLSNFVLDFLMGLTKIFSNFKIFNVQHGNEVQIGNVLAGDLTLTAEPLYHDGSSVVNAKYFISQG